MINVLQTKAILPFTWFDLSSKFEYSVFKIPRVNYIYS